MKRKMIGAAASYIAGLFFASFFIGVIPLLLITAAALIIGRLNKFTRSDYIMLALSFAAAVTVSSLYTHFRYDRAASFDGKTADFSGEITDIRRYDGEKASYTAKGTLDGMKNVRMTFYSDELGAEYGDGIILKNCTLSTIDGDYLTDSMNYFRSERVYLRVDGMETITLEHRHSRRLKNALISYRDRVISDFRVALGEDCGDFLAGMVFGEKQGIDDNIRTSLNRCGIGHVLAVSGLHVSVAVIALMSLLRLLKVNRYISFALMDVLLAVLIVMAHSPVSAIRAAIMMNFLYSARLFRRKTDPLNSLAAALLLICLVNPYAVYSSGLILSAAGTFGIGTFARYMTKNINGKGFHWGLLRSFCAMLCTTVCVMPFTMKFFEESSLISPLVNVFIVPLCSAAMVIGMIYVFTGGFISLLGIAGVLIRFILAICDRLANVGIFWISCRSDRIAGFAITLFAIAGLVQIIFRRRNVTACFVAGAYSLVFAVSAFDLYSRRDRFTIALLGRRGNAAAVITYHGRTNVIDLSGHYKSADYVRKYMLENGIDSVDSLVLTERVQSQYVNFGNKLSTANIGRTLTVGDLPVIGAEDESSQLGDSLSLSCEGYTAQYSDGVLTINYGSTQAVILPVNAEYEGSGSFVVYYGGAPKETPDSENTVYKTSEKGMDNFEVVLTKDGKYKIRRL